MLEILSLQEQPFRHHRQVASTVHGGGDGSNRNVSPPPSSFGYGPQGRGRQQSKRPLDQGRGLLIRPKGRGRDGESLRELWCLRCSLGGRTLHRRQQVLVLAAVHRCGDGSQQGRTPWAKEALALSWGAVHSLVDERLVKGE